MKIKHWQGYGSVNATKVSSTTCTDMYGNKLKKVIIKVKGNHEWGIARQDIYDCVNWLLKHFVKGVTVKDIYNMSLNDYYVTENGIDVEVCDYTFLIKC